MSSSLTASCILVGGVMEFSTSFINCLEVVLVPLDTLIEVFWIETESNQSIWFCNRYNAIASSFNCSL